MLPMPDDASQKYRVVETLRDETGVIATITVDPKGRTSFSLGREFERGGLTQRTNFLGRRHVAAARTLLDQLEVKLEDVEDRERAAVRR